MEIEVLGVGCPKCVKMYEATVKAVEMCGRPARVRKVYDPDELSKYGVFSFPALAVDGQVVSTGKLLDAQAIAHLLDGA